MERECDRCLFISIYAKYILQALKTLQVINCKERHKDSDQFWCTTASKEEILDKYLQFAEDSICKQLVIKRWELEVKVFWPEYYTDEQLQTKVSQHWYNIRRQSLMREEFIGNLFEIWK